MREKCSQSQVKDHGHFRCRMDAIVQNIFEINYSQLIQYEILKKLVTYMSMQSPDSHMKYKTSFDCHNSKPSVLQADAKTTCSSIFKSKSVLYFHFRSYDDNISPKFKKPSFVILGCKICPKNKLYPYRPEACPKIGRIKLQGPFSNVSLLIYYGKDFMLPKVLKFIVVVYLKNICIAIIEFFYPPR